MTQIEETLDQGTLDRDQCWDAMMARSAQADGTFVSAVRSTGIYCRPSCPARHPRREHVVFFRHAHEAEAAGFRACRRCHPELVHLPEPQNETVEQMCRYIETHLDAPLHLSDLSQQFHVSPYHLQRTFKRIKGVTPRQYVEACRLQQFKTQLRDGETVTGALYNAGYQSNSSVYERMPMQLGMTPSAYRQGGKGTQIWYSITKSSLGYVLLATTARGIATLRFGDDKASLDTALVHEYPEAEIIRDEERLQPWVMLLEQYLQGYTPASPIPLDVQASAFQWKVWEALRRIPSGQTRSYQAIAQAIGQPTATRAVACACATNPVAVFIPCHRVVRSNGELGGYRWGLERKKALLARELVEEKNSSTMHKA